MDSIKELSQKITQQNTVIEGMVDDENQLEALIPELAKKTSNEEKAQLLDQEANKNKVIDAAKQKYADQFEAVWDVMADELVGSVPTLPGYATELAIDQMSTKIKQIKEKMGKSSIEESFMKRLDDWSLDVSLIGINDEDRIPERAFQLWGRHAGIDRQTIMGIYSRVASGEPKIDDFISKLAEYCKNKIQSPRQRVPIN